LETFLQDNKTCYNEILATNIDKFKDKIFAVHISFNGSTSVEENFTFSDEKQAYEMPAEVMECESALRLLFTL
jgi:hypothetical protein